MKVLSIAVLVAIVFMANAWPHPYDEENTGEQGGEEEGENPEEGENTTQDPCKQFQEQCSNDEDVYNGSNNGNQTNGNTLPPANPQCQAWKEQCNGQSTQQGGMTTPLPTQPTTPDMSNTNMTTPAPEVPNQNTTMPIVGIGPGR